MSLSPTLTGTLSEIRQLSNNLHHRQALDQAIQLIDPSVDYELTAFQLEHKYTGGQQWGELPRFPREQWRTEVADEDTQLGYWDWVAHKLTDELEKQS